jgi:predicted Rossmann-fold nucleotide-binding protein
VGVLNVGGYFDPLVELVDRGVEQDFIKPKNRELLVVAERPEELLELLARHRLPKTRQWVLPEQT